MRVPFSPYFHQIQIVPLVLYVYHSYWCKIISLMISEDRWFFHVPVGHLLISLRLLSVHFVYLFLICIPICIHILDRVLQFWGLIFMSTLYILVTNPLSQVLSTNNFSQPTCFIWTHAETFLNWSPICFVLIL